MRRLHPEFIRTAKSSGFTRGQLAEIAGLHRPRLTRLLNGARVPATDLMNRRVQQIAKVLGYPRNQCFTDGER
jgi:hypothetical protein